MKHLYSRNLIVRILASFALVALTVGGTVAVHILLNS